MTKKLKPVWRMNTGNGVPIGIGDLHMTKNGCVYMLAEITKGHWRYWDDSWGEWSIVAYQTNRTREAKYEPVKCTICDGKGRIERDSSYYFTSVRCTECRGSGAGKTLELTK